MFRLTLFVFMFYKEIHQTQAQLGQFDCYQRVELSNLDPSKTCISLGPVFDEKLINFFIFSY